jgi:hypothetical protein
MKKGLGLYQDLFFVLVKPAVYFFVKLKAKDKARFAPSSRAASA